MRKLVGWLLITLGGVYPTVLVLLGLFALFVWVTTGRLDSPEQFIGAVWPLGIAVSVVVLVVGVWLIGSGVNKAKEANNAGRQ